MLVHAAVVQLRSLLLRFDRRLVLNLAQNVEWFTVIDLVADTSIILTLDLAVRAADDFDFACHWAPSAARARSLTSSP